MPKATAERITMMVLAWKKETETNAAAQRMKCHHLFTVFLKRLMTVVVSKAAIPTLIPFIAFFTHGMESKLAMNSAIKVIMIIEGEIMPRVAKMAPGIPACLWPTKVETFTAMIPGVDWAMA